MVTFHITRLNVKQWTRMRKQEGSVVMIFCVVLHGIKQLLFNERLKLYRGSLAVPTPYMFIRDIQAYTNDLPIAVFIVFAMNEKQTEFYLTFVKLEASVMLWLQKLNEGTHHQNSSQLF